MGQIDLRMETMRAYLIGVDKPLNCGDLERLGTVRDNRCLALLEVLGKGCLVATLRIVLALLGVFGKP